MTRAEAEYLLRKYRIRPDREKGQHFLVSEEALRRIILASDIERGDRILEIGPGIGNLTTLLSGRAAAVAAVEIDEQYRPLLGAIQAVNPNLTVIYRDILKVPFQEIAATLGLERGESYKIVANIPYYLTSRFISRCLHYPALPERMVLLVQKEVAERIVARPGSHSKLSLSVQFYGEPELLRIVKKEDFHPRPEVDSALLRIAHMHPWSYPESEERTWQLITFGFSAKRKKLVNNLMGGLRLSRETVVDAMRHASVDPDTRAQSLTVSDWRSLARALPGT